MKEYKSFYKTVGGVRVRDASTPPALIHMAVDVSMIAVIAMQSHC
jgi:hypothetical protein